MRENVKLINNAAIPLKTTIISSEPVLDVNIVGAIGGAGLATAAKQDTGNTSLASIDTKLTAPIKTRELPTGAGYYSVRVNVRQTAATAAPGMVWAITNPSASTKTIYVENFNINLSFDSATLAAVATIRYNLLRFTGATPTGGTSMVINSMDTTNPATAVTDARFLDTGLTTAGITNGAPIATFGIPGVQGAVREFKHDKRAIVLAAGAGLAIVLSTSAAAGVALTGICEWSER